jgi:hypothetical protein
MGNFKVSPRHRFVAVAVLLVFVIVAGIYAETGYLMWEIDFFDDDKYSVQPGWYANKPEIFNGKPSQFMAVRDMTSWFYGAIRGAEIEYGKTGYLVWGSYDSQWCCVKLGAQNY